MIIKNNQDKIKHIGPVTLSPGFNVVNDKDWKVARQHPIAQALIREGEFEEKEGQQIDITALKPADALELVDLTFDPAVLKAWRTKERRQNILVAIQKQLRYLNEKPVAFAKKGAIVMVEPEEEEEETGETGGSEEEGDETGTGEEEEESGEDEKPEEPKKEPEKDKTPRPPKKPIRIKK